MIDTINLYTTEFELPEGKKALTNNGEFFARLTGTRRLFVEGLTSVHLRVSQLARNGVPRLFIRVDLPKLIHGNNIALLSFAETEHAFERLQSCLDFHGIQIDVYSMSICRLDRAVNVIAHDLADSYIRLLTGITLPRSRVTVEENGIRFTGGSSCLSIHNKRTAELSKGNPWPFDYDMIRIEWQIRRNRDIRNALSIETVNDLLENFDLLESELKSELTDMIRQVTVPASLPIRDYVLNEINTGKRQKRPVQYLMRLALSYLSESAFGSVNQFKAAVKHRLSASAYKTVVRNLQGAPIGISEHANQMAEIREDILLQVKSEP